MSQGKQFAPREMGSKSFIPGIFHHPTTTTIKLHPPGRQTDREEGDERLKDMESADWTASLP